MKNQSEQRESLYTNIDQREVMKGLEHHPLDLPDRIPRRFFLDLLSLVLNKNFFLYQQQYYLKIYGIAMGATVAPSIATIYMAWFEDQYVYPHPLFRKIPLWRRFLDDIFFLWTGTKDELELFLRSLNSFKNNIQLGFGDVTRQHGGALA